MTAAPTAAASEETPAAQSFPPQALSVFTEGSAVYDAYARPGTHTQPARSAAASAALPPEPATGGTVIQNTSSAAQTITLPSSTAMATAAAAATATATTATRYSYTAASNPGQAVTTTSTTTTTTTTKGTTTSTTTTTTTTTQPVARTLGPVNGVTVEFKSNQLPASASLSVTSGITMNTRVIDPNSPTPATPVATYSIKLQAGGADVQPQGYVTVKLPVPSGVSDVSALRVYHATDAVTTSEMIWHLEGSLICFETNYF
ncbi:MAG: hypothetical protein FWH26_04845 [Oscillospiraceae bacterium]|nr:hypothetical protein [Oscillospiraceae bacterium]